MRSIGMRFDLKGSPPLKISERPLYILPLAVCVTALPIFLHVASPFLGFATCFLIALTLANFAPSIVIAALVFSFAFQNAIVAIVLPWLAMDEMAFNLVRSYNFLMVVAVWIVFAISLLTDGRTSMRATPDRAIVMSLAVLPVVAIYLALGASKDPTAALTYLRNVLIPVLCLQIGLMAGRHIWRRPEPALIALGWLTVGYGYLELIFDLKFLHLFNGDIYLEMRMRGASAMETWAVMMKQTGFVIRDPLDMLRVPLFNTPLLADLDITLFRLHGPNFHPISFAYALAFFGLVGLANRRPALLLAALPLLVFIGSKGAVLMLLFAILAWRAALLVPRHIVMVGFTGMLAAYVALAIVVGMQIGDFHVLGLFGCLEGFFSNPLGHGLGDGGNLTNGPTIEEWQQAQNAGKSTAPVESGIGVLLYQMGIGAVAPLALYVSVVIWCWQLFLRTGAATFGLGAFAIATLLANAVLQEEALFSPLALGTMVLWIGHAIGREAIAAEARTLPTAAAQAGPRLAPAR